MLYNIQRMRIGLIGIGLIVGMSVGGSLYADSRIHAETLDNGLRTYILADPNAAVASVRVVVKAGALHESPWEGSGISHYLEHVVAGGTTHHRTEAVYGQVIDGLGGAFNAYTTDDHTAYYIDTQPERVADAIQIISEWVFDCSFDAPAVIRERGVIQQEMQRAWANPSRLLYRYAQENFYTGTVAEYPVLGRRGRFDALQPADLRAYYQQHYVPNNMIVLVGGAVDVAAVKAKIQSTFGKQAYGAGISRSKPVLQPVIMPRESVVEGPTTSEHVSIRFPAVDLSHADAYALDLLAYVLGNGRQSILHQALVVDQGVANSVTVRSVTPVEAPGYFEIQLSVDPAVRQAAVQAVYDTLNTRTLKRAAIRRAKKQKLAEDAQLSQALPDRLDRIAQSHLATGGPGFYAYYARQFDAITAADLRRVLDHYIQKGRPITTRLTPPNSGVEPMPQADYKQATLNNGVNVFVQPNADDPAVRVVFRLLHGSVSEAPGAGALASQVFGLGNNRLQQRAQSVGARVGLSVGYDESVIELTSSPEDIHELIRHVHDALYDPAIGSDDVAVEQRLLLDRIRKRRDHWAHDAFAQVRADFFKGHPYAIPLEGDETSVSALTPAAIRSVYRSLQQAPLVISVSGDCDAKRVHHQMHTLFGSVAKQPPRPSRTIAPKVMQNSHSKTLKQPVAAVVLAVDAVTMRDTMAHVDWQMLDTVLAGMQYPGGRLHPLLRGQELVYVVHGIPRFYQDHGVFYIYALTSPDSVNAVKNQLVNTLELLKTAGLDPNERSRAKAQMQYAYQQAHDPPSARVHQVARYQLWGLPLDTHQQQLSRLATVEDSDIQAMAHDAFRAWQLYLFLPE